MKCIPWQMYCRMGDDDGSLAAPPVVGDRVTWLHEPRGGYGYTVRVAAVVEKVGPKRVRIAVKTTTGEVVKRWVSLERLKR